MSNSFVPFYSARPLLLSVAAAMSLMACAAMVPSEPARLAPLSAQTSTSPIAVTGDVEVRLSTGYTRTLTAGSHWRPVGALPQGIVYQPVEGVFSIEGHHVHEAYLVVKGSTLQGFYLAGEANFSPLVPSVSLPLGAP